MLFGIVLLIPGLILLAPFFLSLTARLARRAPIAPRLALRDLARYRARSGSALAAISLGVLVAVIVMLAAASRYGNVLDYAGPNLASNQLALHANTPPPAGTEIVSPNGKISNSSTAVNAADDSAVDRERRSHRKGAWGTTDPARDPGRQSSMQPKEDGVGTERSTSLPRNCSRLSGSRRPRSTRMRTS